jgi:hypothetical protein
MSPRQTSDSGVGLFVQDRRRMGRNRPKPLNRVVVLAWIAVAMVAVGSGCRTASASRTGEAVAASATFGASGSLSPSDSSSAASDTALSDPFAVSELESVVIPPAGWRADPVKRTRSHAHQAWISPSGNTAYGVIRMNLPLPFIGPDLVLPRFLDEMRKTEGEARLLSRRNDSRLPGLRFIAEGGRYRIRANLVTRGFRAWAVYAGSLRGQPEVPEELALAEVAREQTRIGTTRVRSRNR